MAPKPRRRTSTVPEPQPDGGAPQQLATSALHQRLLWPCPARPGAEQVDIVQATRLSNRPVVFPPNCGVSHIDIGVRFDPKEYPDLTRKTQEKLATTIIESGKTRDHGRTIKVKEYSSKQRKRIRFACSREECSVTFQINYDSSKGHWFMKRNKGNFEHSCAALMTSVQLPPQTTSLCLSTGPQTPPTVTSATLPPVASSPPPKSDSSAPLTRQSSQSLKRCSPELKAPDHPGAAKRTKTSTGVATRASNEKNRETDMKEQSFCSVPAENEPSIPKTRNVTRARKAKAAREITNLKQPVEDKELARSNAKSGEKKPVKTPRPSTQSVAVSIHSQDVVLKQGQKQSKAAAPNISPELFSTPTHFPELVPSNLPPQLSDEMLAALSPQVVSFTDASHYDTEPPAAPSWLPPHAESPEAKPPPDTEAETAKLPPLMVASASSHASLLDAPDFSDIDLGFVDEHGDVGPLEDPAFLSAVGNEPGASGAVSSLSGSDRVGAPIRSSPQQLETLSQKLSLCSLLVPPTDLAGCMGCWEKATRPDQKDDQDDDNSSISSNWSAIDFKTC